MKNGRNGRPGCALSANGFEIRGFSGSFGTLLSALPNARHRRCRHDHLTEPPGERRLNTGRKARASVDCVDYFHREFSIYARRPTRKHPNKDDCAANRRAAPGTILPATWPKSPIETYRSVSVEGDS